MGQSFSGTPHNVEPRMSADNLTDPPTPIGESPVSGIYGRGRSTNYTLKKVSKILENPKARRKENSNKKTKGISRGMSLIPASTHSMKTRSKKS